MGRHVAGDAPELDQLVDDACAEIGREIDALGVPCLAGVVLGGGYGRGEGGVKKVKSENLSDECGECRYTLSNDLDFFAITEDDAPEAESVAAIGKAIKPVAEKWTEKLGVDVDFAVKTPWRLKHDEERIMVQELLRGYYDVAGATGESLFADIRKVDAADIPWMEAARLLMNRGMGLLFAMNGKGKRGTGNGESGTECREREFVNRNINKCILGAGDAFLVSRGLYRWRAEERAAALASQGDSGLYARAVEWKFRPREEPVCDWEAAREAWLDAKVEVFAAVDDTGCRRSLRSAARWLVRRRTIGELGTFGQDPVVRILCKVARHVEDRRPPDAAMLRDWQVFN